MDAPIVPKKHLPVPQNSQSVPPIDPLKEFLALSQEQQIALVNILPVQELLVLHNIYVDTIGLRTMRPVEYDVYERILERLEPEGHSEYSQDAELRLALTPERLAMVRADTYENQVRPLLHEPPEKQEKRLRLLDRDELEALEKLLDRYAREYGRSRRCSELENLVKSLR